MGIDDLPVVSGDTVFEDEHARKMREAREQMLVEEAPITRGPQMHSDPPDQHMESPNALRQAQIAAEIAEARLRDAQAELARVETVAPDPAVLMAEQARAAEVKRMGPEPNPEITAERLANNPSDYHPPEPEKPANPSVTQVAKPQPNGAADTRQRWICITDMGIRTGHPAFRSDAHLLGQMVRCPQCDGVSVRKVGDAEVLAEDVALLTETPVTP